MIKYLGRDESGIRKVVLNLFLTGDKFTTGEVYEFLDNGEFEVSYRGVSAMVGLMNTRLGILSINVTGDHNVYSLKNTYKTIVGSVLENY
ncbi:DUF2551 domain-containing protein [Methanosarcina sp. Mfa9]|uniref:DUF2551 domain-containing protein n=1 Tax=Methanosarcina sp. Mfa9 TaxID=3439063 RepID=UPI003F85FB2B